MGNRPETKEQELWPHPAHMTQSPNVWGLTAEVPRWTFLILKVISGSQVAPSHLGQFPSPSAIALLASGFPSKGAVEQSSPMLAKDKELGGMFSPHVAAWRGWLQGHCSKFICCTPNPARTPLQLQFLMLLAQKDCSSKNGLVTNTGNVMLIEG